MDTHAQHLDCFPITEPCGEWKEGGVRSSRSGWFSAPRDCDFLCQAFHASTPPQPT